MNLIQPIVLGIVQGLGEFLPISSSGHLIVTSWLAGWKDQGLAFDVALHWGTLLAVLVYFRADIWHLLMSFVESLRPSTRNFSHNPTQRLAWLVIIATIPTAIIGKLFADKAEEVFRNPLIVACTLVIGAILIFIADYFGRKIKSMKDLTWKQAVIIGCSQALAIIPGVSRSGATMTAGLGLGLTRQQTARFSFLLSVPAILGAGLLELPAIFQEPNMLGVGVGFVASAIFGFIAIYWLMKYIENRSFNIFGWYRIGLAVVIILMYLWR